MCGFITPWNWPINQIATKVFPALATGCTMVLKPSEIAPFSGYIFAQVLHAAGVPAGVFNLVNGDGPGVGAAIAAHPDVDMVSFTGSTRAGIAVAKAAADTVKRVHQELGGKSPFIVLEDADVGKAVTAAMRHMLTNSGQSCNAPTRLLVPKARMEEAKEAARAVAEKTKVGDPEGRRPARPGRLRRPVDQDPGPDRARSRRRRDPDLRRARPARRARARLLRPPDRLRRRRQRHDHRPRGDIRAGHVDHRL